MFKNLSTGIKISITRSITITFENYMREIKWNEDKYSLEDFVIQWRDYINETASWYNKIADSIKADPVFHEELATKINETIAKLLSEPPTTQQIEEITKLEKRLGEKFSYSCKAEASFLIDLYQDD